MKKVLSLILAVAMLASFAMVASAAEFEFEITLLDEAQENEVTEVNEGDKVYLSVASSTKTAKYGIEVNIDTTAFEVAIVEEDGDSWEDADFGSHTGSYVINPEGQENVMAIGGVKTGATKAIEVMIGLIAKKAGTYEISFKGQQDKNMPADSTSTCATDPITLVVLGDTPVDPVVTYEGEENLVWGAQGAYAEGKATFSVKPVMGYTVAVTANGEAVAIDAAKGGEVTIDVTEDTTVVATATAITDGAYTYGETYKEGNTVYVFGKAPGAANFGFYVEKDDEALANKALEIYDGYFAATSGSANAFGMAFAFTGKGHTGAYTAAAYGDADVATTTAAFNID